MKQLQSEFAEATAELEFWIDFAGWWKARHSLSSEPRILEAISSAVDRYNKAAEALGEPDSALLNRGLDAIELLPHRTRT